LNEDIENVDYIVCQICHKHFKRLNATHLTNKHNITMKEYRDKYPNAILICENTKLKINYSNKQYYIDNPEKVLEIGKRTTEWHKKHPEFAEELSVRQSGDGNVTKRDDVRKSMRVSSKRRWCDPKEHEKDSIALKKYNEEHPEHGEKHSKFLIEWHKDPNNRDIIRRRIEGTTKYWRSEEGREFARQRRLKQDMPTSDTSIEVKIQDILKENGYDFITHQSCCNICVPDILFPEKKIIIQCDGDYWHNFPYGNEKDHYQDKILKSNGWFVLRFWECIINNNTQLCFDIFEEIYKRTELL